MCPALYRVLRRPRDRSAGAAVPGAGRQKEEEQPAVIQNWLTY